jgi:hypothetical protein
VAKHLGVKVAAGIGVALALAGHSHHGHGLTAVLDAAPGPYSQQKWARAVLREGGWPRTGANIGSLEAWANHEDPWNSAPPDGGKYTKNPLNLTYGPGATGSVPGTPNVSILPDWATGIRDTASLIANYPDISSALQSGNGLCGQSLAGLSTWSGGGYSSVC